MRFIVVLLLVLFPNRQEQSETYSVYYRACCASDQTIDVAETVLQQVQAELERNDIHIQLKMTVDQPSNHDVLGSVEFQEVFDGERIIVDFSANISPLRSPLQAISPVLRDGLGVSILTSEPATANTIACILAYTVADCRMIDNLPLTTPALHLDFYRANCALLGGDLQKAEELYPNALYVAGGGYWLPTTTNLAWTYLQTGNEDRAFELLESALKWYRLFDDVDREVEFLTLRSQLYALTFRYDEAIADMDAAIALDPGNPSLYVERGQRILLLYEWDRALADFNHALELVPGYADAYYFRGILYASVPEGVEARQLALADFQRYLELDPNGQHAASAAENIINLQAQLDALGA